jgi:ribosomal protein L3 glutamine methyltransferase
MSRPEPRPPVAPVDEAARSLRSVRDLIRYAVSRLQSAQASFGHGTDNAWDEAVWLVLWSLHLPLDRLDPMLDARLAPSEIAAAIALVERRCTERLPLAYLTGEAWLRGERFLCDARALVPRSPIADLLDSDALEPWLPDADDIGTVLDLCTGGASLAILAAHRFGRASVIGADLSTEALALAGENIALHHLTERVSLRQGSLWSPLAGKRFDLVLCNPPYVNAASMAELPAEFRHEPVGALAGGDDGMDLIRQIVAGARAHLNPKGLMLLEVGHEALHFEAAFAQLEFIWLPTASGDNSVALIERDALPQA